jgi:hypothetical protein
MTNILALLALGSTLASSAATNAGPRDLSVRPIDAVGTPGEVPQLPSAVPGVAAQVPEGPAPVDPAAAVVPPDVLAASPAPASLPAPEAPRTAFGEKLAAALAAKGQPQGGKLGASLRQDRKQPGGPRVQPDLDGFFDGSGPRRRVRASFGTFVVNDEGIPVNGRAAVYLQEIRQLAEKYKGRVDLSQSLDVMDDTYAEIWSKLATIEAIARRSGVSESNTHLEETLTWVDGVLERDGRRTAIQTTRVFFHRAKNSESIREGIRRADKTVSDLLPHFQEGGRAEQALGPLDDVVLSFDTRGYRAVKAHLKARGKEIERRTGGRVRFAFVDELARVPRNQEAMRSAMRGLIAKYRSQNQGLQKLIEGVTYSRYVGLLLELETMDHYLSRGYKFVQSGRELFDAQGHYVTELDVVVEAPDGRVLLVEARSAREPLPLAQALRDKILYKLEVYRKHRVLISEFIGAEFDVVFAMDVGKNGQFAAYLKAHEAELSREYGFPVSFLFLQSGPEMRLSK